MTSITLTVAHRIVLLPFKSSVMPLLISLSPSPLAATGESSYCSGRMFSFKNILLLCVLTVHSSIVYITYLSKKEFKRSEKINKGGNVGNYVNNLPYIAYNLAFYPLREAEMYTFLCMCIHIQQLCGSPPLTYTPKLFFFF